MAGRSAAEEGALLPSITVTRRLYLMTSMRRVLFKVASFPVAKAVGVLYNSASLDPAAARWSPPASA